MGRRNRLEGVPALLIYFGMGLLFLTITIGFVRPVYWLALPGGLCLLLVGLLWLALKLREMPE